MVDEEKMETDGEVKKEQEEEEEKKKKEEDEETLALESVREKCSQLDRGESHVLSRVMQGISKTRKSITPSLLSKLVSTLLHSSPLQRDQLLNWIGIDSGSVAVVMPMETERGGRARSPRPGRRSVSPISPESELYVHLLVVLLLVDQKRWNEAQSCCEAMIARADALERRSLDPITAKAFFFLALIYERSNKLDQLASYLNSRLRTATLRRQLECQAAIIIALLRLYLMGKHYQAAAQLISKVTFPERANNNDLARFLYYQGRIKAMQLDYVTASGYFTQAMRKAPQDSAIGFKQNVQKWSVVISLLQGEIPERSIFRQPIYRKPLSAYLQLSQAVRMGDLVNFNATVKKNSATFESDETLTLIVRLRQNVIKTAVRQICAAYSRISIKDICRKLQLSSELETEFMVAKAIKDGAIEATIAYDTATGGLYMQSSETADVYRSDEPHGTFDTRIRYCLELHKSAQKALRYPPKSYTKDVESIEEQREREQQELDFAKEMADEDDDDF